MVCPVKQKIARNVKTSSVQVRYQSWPLEAKTELYRLFPWIRCNVIHLYVHNQIKLLRNIINLFPLDRVFYFKLYNSQRFKTKLWGKHLYDRLDLFLLSSALGLICMYEKKILTRTVTNNWKYFYGHSGDNRTRTSGCFW